MFICSPANAFNLDKILLFVKLKAGADDKFYAAQMMQCLIDRVENIVGKGEYAAFHHFLNFPYHFKDFFPKVVKKAKQCGKSPMVDHLQIVSKPKAN